MAEERNPVMPPVLVPTAPDLPAPVALSAKDLDDLDTTRPSGGSGLRADQHDIVTSVGVAATAGTPPVLPDTDDPERIRERIEQTREDMGHTINALQERLSPQALAQQARDSVRDATVGRVQQLVVSAGDGASQAARRAHDAAAPVVEQMREHPMPVVLAGAGMGLVWWMMRRASPRTTWSSDMYDLDDDDMVTPSDSARRGAPREWEDGRWSATGSDWTGFLRHNPLPAALAAASIGYMFWTRRSGVASDDAAGLRSASAAGFGADEGVTARVTDKAREMGEMARETASAIGEQVGETVRDAQARAGEVSRTVSRSLVSARAQTSTQFERWMRENPMAVGVAAMAAGAVIGLTVPRSHVENRAMGATRDDLVDRASDSAHQLTAQVREKVQESLPSMGSDM